MAVKTEESAIATVINDVHQSYKYTVVFYQLVLVDVFQQSKISSIRAVTS